MIQHLGLVTTETLPAFPTPCAGGGVRIWGVGEALRRAGVRCTYFLREGTPGLDRAPATIPIQIYRPESLRQQLADSGCDAALFEQWQPLTFLREPLEIPVFVDLPGPLILEYYWRDRDHFFQHIADKLDCLSRADYFLCAHERQRGYYDAWLTWAGVSPGEMRSAVVPFVFHEMPVSRQGHVEDEPLFFWGGMFWPWQDRGDAWRTLLQTIRRVQRGQLVVAGVPDPDSPGGVGDGTYADHPHITWLGLLGFTEYVTELKRAAVAVDLCHPTMERRLSSDLRTGTALWAGTPCLVTPDSPWAEWIMEHNAGWVIPYEDTKSLSTLIHEIALERVDLVARRRGARAVSLRISNENTVRPLLDWLKNPKKRDVSQPFLESRALDRERRIKEMQEEIEHLGFENDSLRHDLGSIRSHPLFRLYKKLIFWK